MSQDRRLEEILNSHIGYHDGCYGGLNLKDAKKAIIEVMRGCVPEEYDGVDWKDTEVPFVWNAFRTEMLRRIEEVGK